MAVNAVSSNNVPAPAPARQPEAQGKIDKPAEKASPPPSPEAQRVVAPSVNTSGQTTGTRISTSA